MIRSDRVIGTVGIRTTSQRHQTDLLAKLSRCMADMNHADVDFGHSATGAILLEGDLEFKGKAIRAVLTLT